MTTGIGQAYTRRGAQRTSERLGMASCNLWVQATIGSRPRPVLEAVLDEIDFQMVEQAVECRPCITDRGCFFGCSDNRGFMAETGTVPLKEMEPFRPVAG